MPRHKAEVLDTEDPARGIQLRVPWLTALDEDRIHRQLADDKFLQLTIIATVFVPLSFRRKRLDWGYAFPIIPRDWRAPFDPIAIGVPQWPAIADRISGGHRVDCGHGNASGNCRCRASELAPSPSLAACQSLDIGGGQAFTADPPITAFHLLD